LEWEKTRNRWEKDDWINPSRGWKDEAVSC
jgi:hypothetical protein